MSETRWKIVTLPRAAGVAPLSLTLVTPSLDPNVVKDVEEAAARNGMTLMRLDHVLVVEIGPEGPEFEIEHLPTCECWVDPDSPPYAVASIEMIHEWICTEGLIWQDGGVDALYTPGPIETMPPGRFQLLLRTEHTPSTVYGPAESAAWLEVVVP